jgi:hypothetical protein
MNVEKHQTDSFLEAQAGDTSMLAQDEEAERDASNQKNGDTELARISTDVNTAGGDSAVGLTDNQRDVEMAQLGEVSDGVVAQDFAAAQPANPEGNAQPSLGESARPEDTLEEDAFSHPATKEPQRVIWLPLDELGLADAEVRDNEMVGIRSTHRDAVLDSKVSCGRRRGTRCLPFRVAVSEHLWRRRVTSRSVVRHQTITRRDCRGRANDNDSNYDVPSLMPTSHESKTYK